MVHAAPQQFKNHSSNPNLLDRARWGLEGVCHKKNPTTPKHVLVVNLAITEVANYREVVSPLPGSRGHLAAPGWAGEPRLRRAASQVVWETLLVCSAVGSRGCKPSVPGGIAVPGGMVLPHRAVPEPGSHRSAGSSRSVPARCHLLEYPP